MVSCLKPDKTTFGLNKKLNLFITFEIKSWPFYFENAFSLRNPLFGTIKLTENVDLDKYSYCAYGISVDICGTFSLLNSSFGKNVIIFSADLSSSVHVDNKKKYLNSW